jgi:hypothetical protein
VGSNVNRGCYKSQKSEEVLTPFLFSLTYVQDIINQILTFLKMKIPNNLRTKARIGVYSCLVDIRGPVPSGALTYNVRVKGTARLWNMIFAVCLITFRSLAER